MIKAEHKQEVSNKTRKPYDYIQLSIKIGGKEIELKRIFLNYQEKTLLDMAD